MITVTLFFGLWSFSALAHDLKVLSWNVFMIPRPINFTMQVERTAVISQEMMKSDHDLVLFQEAFLNSFRARMRKDLSAKYKFHHYLGINDKSFPLVGSGLFILSRYPFKVLGNVHYSECQSGDCYASKGVSLIEIKVNQRSYQFAVTHMQAGRSQRAREIRLTQLMQVRSLLAQHRKIGVPQLLVGDLNMDALGGTELTMAAMLLGMDSGSLIGSPNYSSGFPTICYKKPGDHTKKWIDHILVEKNFRHLVLNRKVVNYSGVFKGRTCPLSDHYGVEAMIGPSTEETSTLAGQ